MNGIIQLSNAQRKVVLKVYRGSGDARIARRGLVLLLLAEGRSWREIMGITFCSSSLIRNVSKAMQAGGIDWRTGRLYVSQPHFRRNAQLFVDHLQDLCRRLRCYRVIHVICDNASFHKSRLVREFLAQMDSRIQLHFLPKYAPETNPIERVWWHLHENVTRNHRCRDMSQLLGDVYDFLETNNHHYFELHRVFDQAA